MTWQLRKYLENLYVNIAILFSDNTPKGLEIFLTIMEILITMGNLTLMCKKATDEYLNDLSRRRKAMGATIYTPTRGSSRILPIVISIVSCSPLSSYYKLKILLLSCSTCFQVASKSLQSLPKDSYYT